MFNTEHSTNLGNQKWPFLFCDGFTMFNAEHSNNLGSWVLKTKQKRIQELLKD
jgi:hypothetical protein